MLSTGKNLQKHVLNSSLQSDVCGEALPPTLSPAFQRVKSAAPAEILCQHFPMVVSVSSMALMISAQETLGVADTFHKYSGLRAFPSLPSCSGL